jgi:hypothetical protein
VFIGNRFAAFFMRKFAKAVGGQLRYATLCRHCQLQAQANKTVIANCVAGPYAVAFLGAASATALLRTML